MFRSQSSKAIAKHQIEKIGCEINTNVAMKDLFLLEFRTFFGGGGV